MTRRREAASTRAVEVLQTSAMDCGPACLSSALSGLGLPVSVERLRALCQTSVDGTSIDRMEELLVDLGVSAEQVMLPPDWVTEDAAEVLPCIAVTRLPGAATHFVVIWRRRGDRFEVMDPVVGSYWCDAERLQSMLYVHTAEVPSDAFAEWAASEPFQKVLESRLSAIGVDPQPWQGVLSDAAGAAGVDACLRLAASLRGSLRPRQMGRFFSAAWSGGACGLVPPESWAFDPKAGPETVAMHGAVLLKLALDDDGVEAPLLKLPSDLVQTAAPPGPEKRLWALLDGRERRGAIGLLGLAVVGAAALLADGVLLHTAIDLSQELAVPVHRWAAAFALIVYLAIVLLLELGTTLTSRRLGRSLESKLRIETMTRLPRLEEHYFSTRLVSDLAARAHSTHFVRVLPELLMQGTRFASELCLASLAIAVVSPSAGVAALVGAVLGIALVLLGQRWLLERDLRVQKHTASLVRLVLDSLLGMVPLRSHGGERAMRGRHEERLLAWTRTVQEQHQVITAAQLLLLAGLFGCAVVVLALHLVSAGVIGVIMVAFWAFRLPRVALRLTDIARRYPAARARVLRLMEPLDAAVAESSDQQSADAVAPGSSAVSVSLRELSAKAGGHRVLEKVNLEIEPGQHVAIVGASGAGKSSLVRLLLGGLEPTSGELLVDGRRHDRASLERLLRHTTWVDPDVQLFNRSLLENLRYADRASGGARPMADVAEAADLLDILDRLPDGYSTVLGEGGRRLSGGQGQRVRLGRAMRRQDVGLVVLDEAFRGLDRETRSRLRGRARTLYRDTTLLCVTHDVEDTASFDRVIVIDGGRVVEMGPPQQLLNRPSSHYQGLIQMAGDVRAQLLEAVPKKLRMEQGQPRPEISIEPTPAASDVVRLVAQGGA